MRFLFDLFLIYLEMLWPPRLFRFARDWRGPCSGQGMGPAFYMLFLPFYAACAITALATDIAIVAGIIYLATHHVSVH